MTKREKTIAAVVGAAIGLFALDQLLVEPLFTRLNNADTKIAQHERDIVANNTVMRNRLAASKTWHTLAGDRIKVDSSSAESQMRNAVRECAQRANLDVPNSVADKADKEQGYDRLQLTITANGGMQQIKRFLYELQTTDVPIRVGQMQLKSKTDGKDDLTLQLKLTTIFQQPAAAKVAMGNSRTEAFQ